MDLQSTLSANDISECFENVRKSLYGVNIQMLTYKHEFMFCVYVLYIM
jgi:hypothetical protein